MRFLKSIVLALTLPLMGQSLTERFQFNRGAWESSLEKGQSATVRKSLEALLSKEALAVNPADYNDMHTVVALRNLAGRACMLEGAWEDCLVHLQKAALVATENDANAQATLSRIKQQHVEKLREWKEAMAKQEERLKDLDSRPGLTSDEMKLKLQLKTFLEEHRQAVSHSEYSIKSIDGIMGQLAQEKETYTQSAASWEAFLAKEKSEMAISGSTPKYVTEKLEQIKNDDARPKEERISYARRLLHWDPNNKNVQRFLSGLIGEEVLETSEKSTPLPRKDAPKGKSGKNTSKAKDSKKKK